MSRKHCKRKHWLPVNPISLAISGACITPEADLDRLRMRELSAIEAFAKGKARPEEFRDLCDLLNVAETFATMGVGAEVIPICKAVEAELLRMKDQFDECGRMTLTAIGLLAVRDLYSYHDQQRTLVDRSTYERCIKKTGDRIRGGHPQVKVLV